MSIWTIVVAIIACYGIWWGYPKLPPPFNLILVVIVVVVCLAILLNLGGVNTGLHL